MRSYTPEEKQKLLDKFHLMDADNSGELSRDEILQCLKESKLPKEKLDVSYAISFVPVVFEVA